MTSEDRTVLVGCGVLEREIRSLIEKNDWPLETYFLDSALHCELDKLSASLTAALDEQRGRDTIVFYGCCHPLMDEMVGRAGAIRTEGQNCIDMLLGNARFSEELANGAFFLLEEWAERWADIIAATFGTADVEIIREIFHEDRQHLLCIRTPCSGDFSVQAEAAGALVDLPVRWTDATLDNLERVMLQAITERAG
jgi:hypothetical protein